MRSKVYYSNIKHSSKVVISRDENFTNQDVLDAENQYIEQAVQDTTYQNTMHSPMKTRKRY